VPCSMPSSTSRALATVDHEAKMTTQNVSAAANTAQCECMKSSGTDQRVARWTTAGGILSALGICTACCLLPFVLLSLGIAGAWVSALDALAPYKWIFIALTAALLGYGFYAVYWMPKRTCAAGAECKTCQSSRSVRIGLWVGTILAIGGIVFEQVEPYLVR
jgi:mercuric ion transport protein